MKRFSSVESRSSEEKKLARSVFSLTFFKVIQFEISVKLRSRYFKKSM
jgi:hypothetical protein